MKLIDTLMDALPKIGGWPKHADILIQNEHGWIINPKPPTSPICKIIHADDWEFAAVTKDEYEAALASSKQPAWNGVGLPPVGIICEALAPVGKGDLWSWQRVKVVESGIAGAEKECLVYNIETTLPSWVDEFRPIRTEAERRREDFIESLMTEWLFLGHDGEQAGALYDAIAAGKIPGVKLEADHE